MSVPEKLAHFDRGHPRTAHAASGALPLHRHARYHKYTKAKMFEIGKKTELFVRFSPPENAARLMPIAIFAVSPSSSTPRKATGTSSGTRQSSGDPLKFRSEPRLSSDPRTNLRSAKNNWDFWTSLPKAPPDHHRHERPRHSGDVSAHARLWQSYVQPDQRAERAILGEVPSPQPAGIKNPPTRSRDACRAAKATSATRRRASRRGLRAGSRSSRSCPKRPRRHAYHPFDLTKVGSMGITR